ncbi:MAG: hypothetical protein CM15mP74_16830 [Halieaceae bacterium]|nr:MAG: hypothetical protein CM15mP74_16830 [Halieaceae bacterium]
MSKLTSVSRSMTPEHWRSWIKWSNSDATRRASIGTPIAPNWPIKKTPRFDYSDLLPAQLTDDEIDALIDEALVGIDAEGMAAMGPLMGKLKPQLQGRADMGQVSQRVKAKLGA